MKNLIEVENVNLPGTRKKVDKEKYLAMKEAILNIIPTKSPGFSHAEIIKAVSEVISPTVFPNGEKVGWWSKTVQLDLEAKGILIREVTKPLRWWRKI